MNQLFQRLPNQNNFMSQLQQFMNTFKGDPRQQVQQLIQSGKVSQAQLDQAVQMANQLTGRVGK